MVEIAWLQNNTDLWIKLKKIIIQFYNDRGGGGVEGLALKVCHGPRPTLIQPWLNHDVMWQGIIEACKILKYLELSEVHRDFFEALFDMSCVVWFQMFSETKRTLSINNLIITRKTRHLTPRQKLFWLVECVVCACVS